MKIQIIETKESDGDWIKVLVDGLTESCIGFGGSKLRTRDEAVVRANEIAAFIFENGGTHKVLKELESTEI